MKKPIYLDNHASTQLAPEIISGLIDLLQHHPGNASSLEHNHGQYLKKIVDDTKETIRKFFVIDKSYYITFTSGTSESANTIFNSVINTSKQPPKILASAVEHPCVLEPLKYWAERDKCELIIIGVDGKGRVKLDEVEKHSPGSRLGCFMAVQNEIGNIYPISEIGKILKSANCGFLCDGTQAVGKIKLNINKSKIDYFLFSGHKIHALQGIGCIISTKKFEPLIRGGTHQEGLRAGTLNVPGIYTLGKALELLAEDFDKAQKDIKNLRDKLWENISNKCQNVKLTGDVEHKVPHNLHFCVSGIPNSVLLSNLHEKISVSSGSACSSGTVEPSETLKILNLKTEELEGAIRIGLSRYSTNEEIEIAIEYLAKIIKEMKSII